MIRLVLPTGALKRPRSCQHSPISAVLRDSGITSKMGSGLKVCKNGYSLNFNLFQFAKMSRKTRLYDPGTLYHVILRGNGFQRIFQGIHKSPRAVKRTPPKNVFLNCKLAVTVKN